jgi:hypothetical protein
VDIILHPWINGDQIIAEAVYQPPIACVTYWSFVANFVLPSCDLCLYITVGTRETIYRHVVIYSRDPPVRDQCTVSVGRRELLLRRSGGEKPIHHVQVVIAI